MPKTVPVKDQRLRRVVMKLTSEEYDLLRRLAKQAGAPHITVYAREKALR